VNFTQNPGLNVHGSYVPTWIKGYVSTYAPTWIKGDPGLTSLGSS